MGTAAITAGAPTTVSKTTVAGAAGSTVPSGTPGEWKLAHI